MPSSATEPVTDGAPASAGQRPPGADLPQDAAGLLKLAAQSMFDLYAQTVQGMMVVDRDHRVVWISEGYQRFLPALGFGGPDEFVGRLVEEVVPNTLLAHVIETGQAIMVDLLTNKAGTFLVSRVPLRDAEGRVIGALGMVLMDHPESTMQPLMGKFVRLQRELEAAQKRLAAQRRPKYTIASYIGASPAAVAVKRQARRVAATESTVLLLGETGTGKELLAQAIHAASQRTSRPFVGVNIAAIPDTLLEAEFFGVAPGAFTGADRKGREGKFKLADGGTLFLDEIGDMPLPLQAKLLRALQEQEVEPLGSNRVEKVNVRVIAATSRNLDAMVAAGDFRADLYYRLNVLPIRLPSLGERLPDLEPLADSLLDDIARRSGLPHKGLTAEALERLAAHPWPGNIRELRNVLEQAALMTDALHLSRVDIDSAIAPLSASAPAPQAVGHGPRVAGAVHPHGDDAVTMTDTAAVLGQALNPASRVPLGPIEGAAARSSAATMAPSATGLVDRPAHASEVGPPRRLADAVAELERDLIAEALQATGGNKVAAARRLGIARATLYEKLALYGLGIEARPGARTGEARR